MNGILADDDDLMHHSINNLLKDLDLEPQVSQGLGLHSIRSNHAIWADNQGDFLGYNGLINGYSEEPSNQWLPYSALLNGSTIDDSMSTGNPDVDEISYINWGYNCFNGVDFNLCNQDQSCSDSGSRWDAVCDSNKMYDPFKSGPALDDLDAMQLNLSGSHNKSPLRRSQSANNRPTFADMAKKPGSPGSESPSASVLSKDGSVYESQESLSSAQDRKKKAKAFRPAHARLSTFHVPLPIQPDSKYGLDEFEVPESFPSSKLERSFSCNDAIDASSLENGSQSADDAESHSLSNPEPSSFKSAETNGTIKAWFDPKRIFQNGCRTRSESDPSTQVLNNNSCKVHEGSNSRRSNAAYINNLHGTSKVTNTDKAEKSAMNGSPIKVLNGGFESAGRPYTHTGQRQMVTSALNYGKLVTYELFSLLLVALAFFLGLAGQLLAYFVKYVCLAVTCVFKYFAVKVGYSNGVPSENIYDLFARKGNSLGIGLDANIKLPETSSEALNRLINCKNMDPYSILGLSANATDEDVKRYYRRQAILVHPDKNSQSGSEEAFKVLAQAFEMIGTPDKRKLYDEKIKEKQQKEIIEKDVTDLLTKLHEKFEEVSNWMPCNNCGDKHRRFPTDKPVYSARKCNKCQCNHPAKEGDIWAETSFLGFKWHFYACMDNRIYDVTQWVSCQPNMVDKFQPNSHLVRIRMGISVNSKGSRSGSNLNREADLESLLKNLFPNQFPDPTASATDGFGAKQPTDTSKTNISSPPTRKGKKQRVKRR